MAAVPRHHTAIVISIVVAATAVTACALVAIAYMMGWVPTHAAASKALPPAAAAGASKPAVANDLGLLPGESVVTAEEPKPVTPQYARPVEAPRPAERPPRRAAPPPRAPAPSEAAPRVAARPSTPTYQRSPPPTTSYERSARNLCVNCATVTSITALDMGEWEVNVRFEDGTTQTLRYRTRPSLRIGQSVLLEDGRLIPQ